MVVRMQVRRDVRERGKPSSLLLTCGPSLPSRPSTPTAPCRPCRIESGSNSSNGNSSNGNSSNGNSSNSNSSNGNSSNGSSNVSHLYCLIHKV